MSKEEFIEFMCNWTDDPKKNKKLEKILNPKKNNYEKVITK